MVEVTDADREAYLALNMLPEFDAADVRAGRWDNVTGIQAFAAHRTATLQRVIDLANACVDQGIPLTAMVPMLEDMR